MCFARWRASLRRGRPAPAPMLHVRHRPRQEITDARDIDEADLARPGRRGDVGDRGGRRLLRGDRAGPAGAVGAAAGFKGLVVDDRPAAIEFEVAAPTQEHLELSSASLHARLHARDGKAETVCRFTLGQVSELGETNGLGV